MSRTRRSYHHKSETNIWVFSKRNEHLRPGEIAKIVNGMAQERALASAQAEADAQNEHPLVHPNIDPAAPSRKEVDHDSSS
jgi:hypothetical protein